MDKYIQKAALKAGQGYLRDQEASRVSLPSNSICEIAHYTNTVQNGYVISAPDRDERNKKMKDRAKLEWEVSRYERAGIPAHDIKVLMKVKHNAKNLDAGHSIGPLKFGKASIVGLLPVVGDFADVLLAYWDVYLPARKISDGKDMTAFKSGMKVRIVCLGCIGSIPVVGDFADTIIKWNMRNAAALEKLLLTRAGYYEAMKGKKAPAKTAKTARPQRPAEYTPTRHSEEELGPPPQYEREQLRHRNDSPVEKTVADDRTRGSQNTGGATGGSNTGAKIGAAVGGWLGGLHGRASKNNARQNTREELEGAPQRPPRPAALD